MALEKPQIERLYKKRAKHYDVTANLYYAVGFREQKYRKMAIRGLGLGAGDAVIEIGCGTGLNFALLRDRVGPKGKVTGVDLTPAMLEGAKMRIERNGWDNVEVLRQDAADFAFPGRVDGVISTFALTMVPEFDRVIESAAAALSTGKKLVVLDFKKPRWPQWLLQFFLLITRPFGVTLDLADRHPWESMARHMKLVSFEEIYFGLAYIAVGEAR